ncbi:MAG: hypothetical protein KIS92_21685 [Planctomycetota bacterium]|nr:hypothetical protein [Planctomycetota bacterium]
MTLRAHAEDQAPVRTAPAAGPASEGAGDAGRKPFYLIVDYLPAALYTGERFTACLRAENATSAAAEVTVRAETFDATGKRIAANDEKLAAPAGGFGEYKKEFDLKGVARLAFTLVTPQGEVPGPAVALVREADPWPAAALVEGRLTDKNAVQIPIVERAEKEVDRTFAPIVWALGLKDQDAKTPVTRVLLALPGAWGKPAADGVDFGAIAPAKAKAIAPLGPYEPSGCPPMLRAFNEVLRAVAAQKEAPERVVIVLPPEDLEVATGPRVYRIVLDGLLARLKRAGVRQAILAAPCKFGVPEAQARALAEEVRQAARGGEARTLELADELGEAAWRLEPGKPGVYGRRPNEEGQKRIAQKLEDLLP